MLQTNKSDIKNRIEIEAIDTLAMSVVQYSFNVINWTLQDIRGIDTKIRKMLTSYKMHHTKADKNYISQDMKGAEVSSKQN